MSACFTITCPTEATTFAFGAHLSELVVQATAITPFIVHLSGPLGVGKSSLCRSFLRALGVQGAIKSPSYALMEVYNLSNCSVYHFDFYRLSSPLELLEYGLLEPMEANKPDPVVCLVEWPEQAQDLLPKPDLYVQLVFAAEVQTQAVSNIELVYEMDLPRQLVLQAFSSKGQAVVLGCQAWLQQQKR